MTLVFTTFFLSIGLLNKDFSFNDRKLKNFKQNNMNLNFICTYIKDCRSPRSASEYHSQLHAVMPLLSVVFLTEFFLCVHISRVISKALFPISVCFYPHGRHRRPLERKGDNEQLPLGYYDSGASWRKQSDLNLTCLLSSVRASPGGDSRKTSTQLITTGLGLSDHRRAVAHR